MFDLMLLEWVFFAEFLDDNGNWRSSYFVQIAFMPLLLTHDLSRLTVTDSEIMSQLEGSVTSLRHCHTFCSPMP